MRWFVAAALVWGIAVDRLAGEPAVSLTLVAVERQRVADGIVLRATLTLEGGSDYIALPPLLQAPPWASGPYPSTELVVEVADSAGKVVAAQPPPANVIYVQTQPPKPCQFHILQVGSFAGRVLRLSGPDFRYALPRGTFKVTVRTRSSAREWLVGALASGALKDQELCIRPTDVFVAPLVSNAVEVSLE
jgi:hypothetical protein